MQFDYENILRKLMTPEIVSALGVVKQRQWRATAPQRRSPGNAVEAVR